MAEIQKIDLKDRKILAEIAISDPNAFSRLAAIAGGRESWFAIQLRGSPC